MVRKNKDPAAILFGEGVNTVNVAELSRATGIPHSTLSRWKRMPGSIPLEGAVIIAKARKISQEEWGSLI